MAGSTVRIGVLGCGRIAERMHLPALSRTPGALVTAIADQDAGRLTACRALAPGAEPFADFRALLASRRVDAVVICLPPALHAAAAVASFAQGLHVYVEKPLATSVEDARLVVDAWRRAGTIGQIGFNYRFHPLLAELRAQLARGAIGDPVAVHATFSSSGREMSDWKRRRASGGGALLDLGVHQIDLLRFVLAREIVEVGCVLGSRVSEDDTALMGLGLSGGVQASVLTSLSSIDEHRLEVTGARGQLRFDRYRTSRLHFVPAHRDFGTSSRLRATIGTIAAWPRAVRDALMPPREPSFARALAAFVGAAAGAPPAGPDLADGLQSVAIVAAAERSARTGERVALTMETSAP